MGVFLALQGSVALLSHNFGRFASDQGIMQVFKRYQVNPEMSYYISGSDAYPNALMSLDKHYVLESNLWKRVEMTPALLKEIDTHMKVKVSKIRQELFGFLRLDPWQTPWELVFHPNRRDGFPNEGK